VRSVCSSDVCSCDVDSGFHLVVKTRLLCVDHRLQCVDQMIQCWVVKTRLQRVDHMIQFLLAVCCCWTWILRAHRMRSPWRRRSATRQCVPLPPASYPASPTSPSTACHSTRPSEWIVYRLLTDNT